MILLILRLCTILIHSLILLLLVHVHPTLGDPPGPSPDPYGPSFNPSMGAVIIVLLGALFFMGFFSIYIRHYSQDESSVSGSPSSQQRRVFMGSSMGRARRAPRGLDRAVVESFPTFDYSSVKELKIGKGALECAVCLTEFEDDDVLRLLPNCDHVFHPECIDTWLVAHTTCPVCRSDLVPRDHAEVADVSLHVTMETDNAADLIMDGTTSIVEEGSREDHVEEEYINQQQVQLHRNRTMRRDISIGRPRWLGRMRFGRSYSTGHVAVKQWEDMERFTLRLPEEVRKQLVSGKLERTISLVVLPRETSSRRGYRTGTGTGTGTGLGEGSSRGGRFGSNRSDRWVFSLVPPFFSRASSVKSPKVVEPESRRDGSVRSDSNRVPVP